jgi:hypothetical protein
MKPLENYKPRAGDRLLVKFDGSPEGGVTGTVRNLRNKWWVEVDGIEVVPPPDGVKRSWFSIVDVVPLLVLHRLVPPRPKVESFTRSDGLRISTMAISNSALSPEDADNYARLYQQTAEKLRWEAIYGEEESQ